MAKKEKPEKKNKTSFNSIIKRCLSLLGILFEMRFLNLNINFIADFFPHLGRGFFLFVFLTTFWPNFTSGRLRVITATSDRNAESCNRNVVRKTIKDYQDEDKSP